MNDSVSQSINQSINQSMITRSTRRPQNSAKKADPTEFLLLPLCRSDKNSVKNSSILITTKFDLA